jgi:hypothetical protein
MAFVEKGDLKAGFWIGLGVAAALFVWALIQGLAGRARSAL